MILFLAGLQGIPEELSEAAAIDGASLLADPAPHHAAAARPDDPHLGVPVDHRLAAAVRPRLHHLGPVRRLDRRHLDDGDLHGRQRAQRRQLRLRQRRRRGDVPHLLAHRADLPALRAAPRHRRARSPEGRPDGRIDHRRRPAPGGRPRRRAARCGQPGRSTSSRSCSSRSCSPRSLYIILGGFRTNSQITVDPAGLPTTRGSSANYVDVLASDVVLAPGGQLDHRRPSPRPSASSCSGSWRATCSPATSSAGAERCTRCSPPASCSRSPSRSRRCTSWCATSGLMNTLRRRHPPADRVRAADDDHHPGAVPAGDPERDRGGRGHRRLQPARLLLAHGAPAVGAGCDHRRASSRSSAAGTATCCRCSS